MTRCSVLYENTKEKICACKYSVFSLESPKPADHISTTLKKHNFKNFGSKYQLGYSFLRLLHDLYKNLNFHVHFEFCAISRKIQIYIKKFFYRSEEYENPTLLIVFEVILALIFCIGSVLNTVIVIVFFRRRGFRSHLSNR